MTTKSNKDKGKDEPREIRPRKAKKNTVCGHLDREHYAKGQCSRCYRRPYINEWMRGYRKKLKAKKSLKKAVDVVTSTG